MVKGLSRLSLKIQGSTKCMLEVGEGPQRRTAVLVEACGGSCC